MNSRSDKYYDNTSVVGSRTTRNSELYKDIGNTELDNFDVQSNATVIGESKHSIDVEKIKSILDTHYNDVPRRKSIKLEDERQHSETSKKLYETKEYDINVILDKAKEEKEVSYEEERNKKIRDTQYDILNNLDLNEYVEDYEDETKSKNDDLESLINTISINEQENKTKSISLPSDTSVLELFDDLIDHEGENEISDINETKTNQIPLNEETSSLDKSFFTTSNSFKSEDFEDFKDLEEKPGIVVKIIVGILLLLLMFGGYILVKTFIS